MLLDPEHSCNHMPQMPAGCRLPYCATRRCALPTSSPDALLLRVTQIAIAATDLAEIIGSAIALYLLFGLPVWAGVLITGLVSVPKP